MQEARELRDGVAECRGLARGDEVCQGQRGKVKVLVPESDAAGHGLSFSVWLSYCLWFRWLSHILILSPPLSYFAGLFSPTIPHIQYDPIGLWPCWPWKSGSILNLELGKACSCLRP